MGALLVIGFPVAGASVGTVAGGAIGWLMEEPSDLPGFGALAGAAIGFAVGAVAGAVVGVAVLS